MGGVLFGCWWGVGWWFWGESEILVFLVVYEVVFVVVWRGCNWIGIIFIWEFCEDFVGVCCVFGEVILLLWLWCVYLGVVCWILFDYEFGVDKVVLKFYYGSVFFVYIV